MASPGLKSGTIVLFIDEGAHKPSSEPNLLLEAQKKAFRTLG